MVTNDKSGQQFTLDRTEGSWAIIEGADGSVFRLPSSLLPGSAKEGSIVRIKVSVDSGETGKKLNEIRDLMEELFEDEKGS